MEWLSPLAGVLRGIAIDQQTRLPAEPLGAHPAGRGGSHQLWSQDPAQRCCCGLGLLAVLPWGPAGAGPLNKLFISAGHFFSSSCGTGLPEGICLSIPAGAWGETVKKWLKHSAFLQPMPFLYCSVLSLIFFFLMRMQMSEDLTLPFYYLLVVLQ